MKALFFGLIWILTLNLGLNLHSQTRQETSFFRLQEGRDSLVNSVGLIVPPRLRAMKSFVGGSGSLGFKGNAAEQKETVARRDWEPLRHRHGKSLRPTSQRTSFPHVTSLSGPSGFELASSSDSVSLAWLRYYSSNLTPSTDVAELVAIDSRGNIFITGYSDSTLSFVDIVTIKYSPNGALRWMKRYTSSENNQDSPTALAVDRNGNVYVAGTTLSWSTWYDFFTIKYDSNGVEQWIAKYDGPDHDYDLLTSMAVDSFGNVYVGGGSFSLVGSYDYLTIKYDANGVEEWIRRYDGSGGYDDGINALTLDNSGNVYVTGLSNSVASADIRTIKYNSSGVEQWNAEYDGPATARDEGQDIKVDNAANVFITGDSHTGAPSDQLSNYVTIKYDQSGSEQWLSRYTGQINSYDIPRQLALDNSGNVYVAGESYLATEFLTIKYNSDGVLLWAQRENPGNMAFLWALALDPSENVVVTGSVGYGTYSAALTIKYQSNGTKLWEAEFDGGSSSGGNHNNGAGGAGIDSSGNIIVVGVSTGVNTYQDFATVKYSSGGIPQWVRRYNGVGGSRDWMQSMKVDRSGNVYLAINAVQEHDSGQTTSMILAKYSAQGDTIWTRRYDDATLAYFQGMQLDSNGNIYVTGAKSGGTATVKYDSAGSQLWSKLFFKSNGSCEPWAMGIDRQGNVFVGGVVDYADSGNNFMIKYDPAGTLLWSSENSSNEAFGVVAPLVTDGDGNVAMTGYRYSGSRTIVWDPNGNKKWLAIGSGFPGGIAMDDSGNTYITATDAGQGVTSKYNADGTLQWSAPRGGYSIAVDAEEQVYVAAGPYLVKFSRGGVQEWSKAPIPGIGSLFKVQVDNCGYIYAAGTGENQDILTYKYDQTGEMLWRLSFNVFKTGSYRPYLEVDRLGQIYVAGTAFVGNARFYASYLAKVQQVPAIETNYDSLQFGEVSITCAREDTLTLSSSICCTRDAFSVMSIDSTFSVSPIGSSMLSPSSLHQYIVRFQATSPGLKSSTITFLHPPSNVSASMQVQGTGVIRYPEYSAQSLQYPSTTIGCREAQTLTIKNLRCVPLRTRAHILEGVDFTISPESTVVPPKDSVVLNVSFFPLAVGQKTAHVILMHDQSPQPDTIIVQGLGVGTGNEVAFVDSVGIGWQLISVPVEPACPFVLPGSFLYDKIYRSADTLVHGKGYWNKFKFSPLIFAGMGIDPETLAVNANWNMIGSSSVSIQASSVTSQPAGIIRSQFYEYTSSHYTPAISLEPGRGYWVKVSQSGQLILQQNAPSVAKHPGVDLESTCNTLTLEDAHGKVQTLYFTSTPIGQSLEMYELPPIPPDGAFDVRFASGRMLEGIDSERKEEFPILISSAHYPVTLSWDVRDANSAAVIIGGRAVPLTKEGSLQISSPESRVVLRTLGRSPVPREFSLGQNYPNPFNPTTRLEYGLPTGAYVRLSIYNVLGQVVASVVNQYENAGWKSVEYDAGNLPSGLYFYRLEAGQFDAMKKMLILK